MNGDSLDGYFRMSRSQSARKAGIPKSEYMHNNLYLGLRKRMVEEQIIRRGFDDTGVVRAILKVERHRFVEEALGDSAYGDYPLPIGEGQTISQPYMVALMTSLLGLTGKERVLEIGTGSGYQAAVLAELAAKVYTVEKIKKLAKRAEEILIGQLGYKNVLVLFGDGSCGWSKFAPYDRIIVTASAPQIPQTLINQLAPSGRLVIPVGDRFSQVLMVVKKEGDKVKVESSTPCVFVPLIGKYGWQE